MNDETDLTYEELIEQGDNEIYADLYYGNSVDVRDIYGVDGHSGGLTMFYRSSVWSTLFGPDWREEQDKKPSFELKRGLYKKIDKVETIAKLLISGMSIRETAIKAKVSKTTVRKHKKIWEEILKIKFKCPCGLLSSHQGWCSYRYKQSEKRQIFIKNWR